MIEEDFKRLIAEAVGNELSDFFKAIVRGSESKYTVYSWLEFWYIEFKQKHTPPLSDSGLYQIRNCIDKHIKPHLEDKPLHNFTALDCLGCINAISSSRMAVYAYDTLCDSLNRAVMFGEIKQNPLLKVDKPKHKRAKKMPLTHEQERQFIKYIKGNRLENLYLFYLASGVRKSEALAIKWTDIDLVNNRFFVAGTKTENAPRFIPLFDNIKIIFARQPHKGDYVFPYKDYTIKNNWRWLTSKHPDINYTIHSLRHTFATRCYESGIADKVIQKWLGHGKVATTQNIYIDVLSDFENEAVKQLNSAIKTGRKLNVK